MADIVVTFGSIVPLGKGAARVRLVLIPKAKDLPSAGGIIIRTSAELPPSKPGTETFTFGRVPYGAHAAIVFLESALPLRFC